MTLILTAACNLRCAYCFENAKRNASMSWEVVRAALDRALDSPARTCTVLFFGGEPTLEFTAIRRAVAYALGRRPPWKRFRWAINTNGTLLGSEELDFLERHRFAVQLSMDGVREAQLFRGPGTFEKLDALLDRVRSTRPRLFRRRLSISMTVSPTNLPHLGRSVDYLLRKRVREIRLSPLLTFDPGWRPGMEEDLGRELRSVHRISVEHFRRFGNVPVVLFRKPRRRPRASTATRNGLLCSAGSGTQVSVDVDGATHACAMFARSYQTIPAPLLGSRIPAIELGDVRSDELGARLAALPEALASTEILRDPQDKYSSLRRCGECRFLADCAICPAAIGHIPGNDDPRRIPDFLCAFNFAALECRRRFPVSRPRSSRFLRRESATAAAAWARIAAVLDPRAAPDRRAPRAPAPRPAGTA